MDSKLAPRSRIIFDGLKSTSTAGMVSVVTVYLTASGDRSFEGTCEGGQSPTAQLETAATAALHALSASTDGRIVFGLRRAAAMSELNTVVVHLSVARPAGETELLLCGSAFLSGHPLHAAVKATLQATNRLFETGFIYLR